jgi:integrating conjugative element protein (TIGR03749 family)
MMPGLRLDLIFSRCLMGSVLLLNIAQAGEEAVQAVKPKSPSNDIPPGLGISSDGQAIIASKNSGGEIDLPVERLFWDKSPLPITLTVGVERLISFPGNVRVGIPNALAPILRSQSQNGTVYWLARQPFETTRVQVQDSQSGQFYLVDLQATEQPVPASRVEISNTVAEYPSKTAAFPDSPYDSPNSTVITTKAASTKHKKAIDSSDFIVLTRHAAQQLYTPTRLIKAHPDIHAVPLTRKSGDLLIRGGQIADEPVAAWRKGRLVVTAVKLINRSPHTIELDPRLIRGSWVAATFQHGQLGPSFGSKSETVVYLITDVATPESD